MTTGLKEFALGVPNPHGTASPRPPAVIYTRHTPAMEDHPHEKARVPLE